MTKPKEVTVTAFDRVIASVAPEFAVKRVRARMAMAMVDGYISGSTTRRSMSGWLPYGHDADSAINQDLSKIRNRSSWLIRNNPLSTGAINTVCTNAVGSGLKLQCRIDRGVLGLDDEAASAWESDTERKWRFFAESKDCDIARTLTFYAQQDMVLRSTLEKGDVFAAMVYQKRKGNPFGLKFQIIESERVSNPAGGQDTATLSAGVEKDTFGAPIAYYVQNQHPGNRRSYQNRKWKRVPAFNPKTGQRVFHHIYRPTRPGQTRGVPYLAPVIELLLQLGRYTEAEAKATLISSLFTVFVTSPTGDGLGVVPAATTENKQATTSDEQEMELEGGTVMDLNPGEDIKFADPGRPNTAFDAFVLALSRQIGVALELPFEILVKHFTASYSAARGALLEAWKFYRSRRAWLVQEFCDPAYAAWLDEAVAIGVVTAPGYFQDPFIRKAYLGSMWEGPTMPQIDPLKEVNASEKRMATGISTIQEETAQITGGDWEKNHPQSVKEHKARLDGGLIPGSKESDPEPDDNGGNDSDKEKPDDAD